MNETDAKKLTERIVGTWPASPKGFVWTDVLLTLDATIARAAIDQLTREHEESRLPVARFLGVYRGVSTNGNTTRLDQADECATCAGTGMQTAHQTIGLHTYDVVVACECSNGKRGGDTVRRVANANAAAFHGERPPAGPAIIGPQPPEREP